MPMRINRCQMLDLYAERRSLPSIKSHTFDRKKQDRGFEMTGQQPRPQPNRESANGNEG